MSGCMGCEGIEQVITTVGPEHITTELVHVQMLGLVCGERVDCTVVPAAMERGEQWFRCSRPWGHRGVHMACSLSCGWNTLGDAMIVERHPAYTWGLQEHLDFTALQMELTWLESGARI